MLRSLTSVFIKLPLPWPFISSTSIPNPLHGHTGYAESTIECKSHFLATSFCRALHKGFSTSHMWARLSRNESCVVEWSLLKVKCLPSSSLIAPVSTENIYFFLATKNVAKGNLFYLSSILCLIYDKTHERIFFSAVSTERMPITQWPSSYGCTNNWWVDTWPADNRPVDITQNIISP